MKNFRGPKKSRHLIPLLSLTALLCVGVVELAVCSVQDPELFQRLTAPARECAAQLGEAGTRVWDAFLQASATVQLPRHWEDEEPEPELPPPEESQELDNEVREPPPLPVAATDVTALAERDGRLCLTGGARSVVYYDQTDPAWAEEPYGSDRIGGYGCGPVAMAMAVSSMTEHQMDPAQMAQWCVDQGYWARKHGSYLSIVPGTAEAVGLASTSIPPEEADPDDLLQRLATGQMGVALMGPGHFTNGGHFILLRGVTLDGRVLVADPASPERSLTLWDLELVLGELSPSRHDGAPLWMLSPPIFDNIS